MKAARSRAAATRKDSKEAKQPAENKIVGKRKVASRADKIDQKRSKNVTSAKKDPNKPKRPATAFFVFLEEFRTIYKQEHPKVKAVSAVGKAGGEKWKSMSNEEKAPYKAKAAKRKLEYEKLMADYNKKQETTDDEEEADSESSKSQANDKDDEESEDEEDEDEDDD
ncbi:high mobility group B protein 3-like isoform X2 [Hibiscus syriacus]|uniref:high mobility group B protein 3-like isoform X2 n=1 Tax=Hibiscus syriacus TaxID=106335 RepID=UPI0019215172|nr:high mobility group B protein 3-like isoform X2 [Hibiscus syriacus]